MAIIKSNNIIKGLSGGVGEIVLKQYGNKTIITTRPDRSKVKLSPQQRKANDRFKLAVKYAKEVINDPAKRRAYEAALKPGKSVYHTALQERLNELKNAT